MQKRSNREREVTYILECLHVHIAGIRTTNTVWGCRCSSSCLRDNCFMLNGARAHYSIYSSMCHSTSSTKSHACNKESTKNYTLNLIVCKGSKHDCIPHCSSEIYLLFVQTRGMKKRKRTRRLP